jgi:hypothetical protein
MIDAWYLPAESYYVAEQELGDYPVRQGDVFPAPETHGAWAACQLLHPSCELAKQAVHDLQIVRVRRLDDLPAGQQPAVTAGWEEKNGAVRVAFANTFFLPPVPDLDPDAPLFANFREIALVPKDLLGTRLAALTHEARVTFIRRHMNFQYRLLFSHADVQALEADRIASDTAFVGARPQWATGDQ